MVQKNAPVAVFDSGHGGISVLRELVRLLGVYRDSIPPQKEEKQL